MSYTKVAVKKALREWAVHDESNKDIVKHALENLSDSLLYDATQLEMADEYPVSSNDLQKIASDVWRARNCFCALVGVFDD